MPSRALTPVLPALLHDAPEPVRLATLRASGRSRSTARRCLARWTSSPTPRVPPKPGPRRSGPWSGSTIPAWPRRSSRAVNDRGGEGPHRGAAAPGEAPAREGAAGPEGGPRSTARTPSAREHSPHSALCRDRSPTRSSPPGSTVSTTGKVPAEIIHELLEAARKRSAGEVANEAPALREVAPRATTRSLPTSNRWPAATPPGARAS